MSNSHFTSNVIGAVRVEVASLIASDMRIKSSFKAGAITGTTLVANTSASAPTIYGGNVAAVTRVKAGQYIQIGTSQYLIPGAIGTTASIVPAATLLVGTNTIKGSVYLSTSGKMWFLKSDSLASQVGFQA